MSPAATRSHLRFRFCSTPAVVLLFGRCAVLRSRLPTADQLLAGKLGVGRLQPAGRGKWMPNMRLLLACFTLVGIAACATQQSQSEHALVRYDDEWRQKQAILDAEAILQGM